LLPQFKPPNQYVMFLSVMRNHRLEIFIPIVQKYQIGTVFKTRCGNNGANLNNTEAGQGMMFVSYTVSNDRSNYDFKFKVLGIEESIIGSIIDVQPAGIVKYSLDCSSY
jgi:hypothetical protein